MLTVHHSNRLERLLDRLVEVTAATAADPLAAEVVVTQSRGMARWVAFGLAERRGVAANIDFALPAAFIWRLFQAQHPDRLPAASGFDRDALTWRLMGLLPQRLGEPVFEPLAAYLNGPRPERRRFQLCRRIADVFDQYLVYRHDMVLGWEAGEGDDWQAQLWRALAGDGAHHRARLIVEALATPRLAAGDLPSRVCIFGIPSLPPAYLDVLRRLAEQVEVHLFLLNPCAEYWGDIEDPKRLARLRRRGGEAAVAYRESGNPLLASWGRQGREFFDALVGAEAEFLDGFEAPAGEGLLAGIQRDILVLVDRRVLSRAPENALGAPAADGLDLPSPHPSPASGRGGVGAPAADGLIALSPTPLPEGEGLRAGGEGLKGGDGSLQVHVCHGPMREVEVLHDRLLALFDADESLSPRDVVVMTPAIERYAPYIEAVFGAAPAGRHLPYAIADLSRRGADPVVQAFLQLLDTVTSRYAVSEVLDLLEVPAVRRRFGLDGEALADVRRWIGEVNIRWGLDGAGRGRLDLPPTETHTWAFGLRRLFLGLALPPDERLFDGVLPYPHIEGQGAVALGRLQRFLESLAGWRARLEEPRSAADWAAHLNGMLDAFFAADADDQEPVQAIRAALADLVEETLRAGFDGRLGLDVLRDDLRARLAEPAAGQHFLTGRITFCAMLPMRSLPFKVVCLIGLGDQEFPRQRRPLGFDRMAAEPRPGDRSRREDDRTLFLEALLSARDTLHLSYVGRSARDNSVLLPSVLVSELLDYVEQGWGKATRNGLIVEHPLQPFSPRAFGDGPLFSYAAEWLAARDGTATAPFCPEPLPAAEADDTLELTDLIRFFRHPGRAFLRQRLGVVLAMEEAAIEDEEPFQLDGPDAWNLKDEALQRLLAGADEADVAAIITARGTLPEGEFGRFDFDRLTDGIADLAERIRRHLATGDAVELDLPCGETRLVGWVANPGRDGLVRYRAGNIGAADRLAFWIEHLALCAARPQPATHSRYFLADTTWTLGPVADAAGRLAELVALYREGQNTPLPLFPKSGWKLMEPAGPRTRSAPIDRALSVWRGGYNSAGEGEDPYWRIVTRGVDNPLDERFVALAEAVFGPMVAAEVAEGE